MHISNLVLLSRLFYLENSIWSLMFRAGIRSGKFYCLWKWQFQENLSANTVTFWMINWQAVEKLGRPDFHRPNMKAKSNMWLKGSSVSTVSLWQALDMLPTVTSFSLMVKNYLELEPELGREVYLNEACMGLFWREERKAFNMELIWYLGPVGFLKQAPKVTIVHKVAEKRTAF